MQPAYGIIAALAIVAAAAIAWIGAGREDSPAGSAPAASGIQGLEAQVARAPDNGAAWKSLAEEYRRRGRTADAVSAYVRAARLNPNDPEIILALNDLAAAMDR